MSWSWLSSKVKVAQGKHHTVSSCPFVTNQSDHSWNTDFSKFELEHLMSRSWFQVQGHIVGPTSYYLTSFHSMSIGPTIPDIWLLQKLFNLENPSSRSWRGQSSKSHPIHSHPFVLCHLALLFLRHVYFKTWPWKSKVVMGEVKNSRSHSGPNILSTPFPLILC